jgi:cytochrome P450
MEKVSHGGPRGRLLTGNLPDFARDPLEFVTRTAREHGPVARLRFGRARAVLISDPGFIEAVLVRNRSAFVKARALRAQHRLFGNGLLTNEGDSWLRQRRLAQPAFHPARMASHADVVASRTSTLLARWKAGERVDVHEEMKGLLMGIVAEALFGADVAERAVSVGEALESLMDRWASRRGLARLVPDWAPLGVSARYTEGVRELDEVVRGMIATRRQSGEKRADLLGMLLAARDENGDGMSDVQVRDEAITLFVGGFDTPALAMSWIWYLLSTHPDHARRVAEEADLVLAGRLPTLDDLNRLTYTTSVVKEAMRLYPPAWLLAREAVEDVAIEGHTIERGAAVLMSPWVVHRDERLFDDAPVFDPDRWIDGRTSALHRFAYFPFGGGPRVCIGAAFAMMETTLVLSMLAQRFQFVVENAASIHPRASMTLRPHGGVPAVVTPR